MASIRQTYTIKEETLEKLNKLAEKTRIKRSGIIDYALNELFDKLKDKGDFDV